MILVDTTVWINGLRNGNHKLEELLFNYQILIHDIIIGELSCGNLNNRTKKVAYFGRLPKVKTLTNAEVLDFLEANKLYGQGIGWSDCTLLASSLVSGCKLWTLDKNLKKCAKKFGVDY